MYIFYPQYITRLLNYIFIQLNLSNVNLMTCIRTKCYVFSYNLIFYPSACKTDRVYLHILKIISMTA